MVTEAAEETSNTYPDKVSQELKKSKANGKSQEVIRNEENMN